MRQFLNVKLLPVLALLFIMASVISFSTVRAYASESADSEISQHVYDKAELLSTTEQEELEQMCIDYGTKVGIDIMILTHNDPNAVYAEDYIKNFEDELPVGDRVYILLDMQNRDVFMEGYGKAETYIHSKRISAIIEEITPDLSAGNYYDAFATYIERSAAYMTDDSELNYDHDYTAGRPQSSDPNAPNYDATWRGDSGSGSTELTDILSNVWVQLLAAIVIGIITVSVMAFHSSGRMTAGSANYIEQNNSGLIGRRDDYVRTQVTKVRKPQNNNNNSGGFNAGGFRGGVSGGGRSHSSGGGKF